MNGGKLMHLAPKLLVGLLVQASILNIDRNNASDNLDKTDLVARKIARLTSEDANDSNQALSIAEENDRQGHQTMIVGAISLYFGSEIRGRQHVINQQGLPFFGHPPTIALAETQGKMHTTQGTRPIRGTQCQDALQLIIEENRAEIDLQLISNCLGRDLQGLIQIHSRVANPID